MSALKFFPIVCYP